MKYRRKLNYTVHPGEHIAEYVGLDEGLSESKSILLICNFSKESGIDLLTLTAIINGKWPIEPKVAEELEKATGYSKQFWLNLQSNYDKDTIRLNKWYNKLIRWFKRIIK